MKHSHLLRNSQAEVLRKIFSEQIKSKSFYAAKEWIYSGTLMYPKHYFNSIVNGVGEAYWYGLLQFSCFELLRLKMTLKLTPNYCCSLHHN